MRIRGPSDGISAPDSIWPMTTAFRSARSANCSTLRPRDSRTACSFQPIVFLSAMRHLAAIRGWPARSRPSGRARDTDCAHFFDPFKEKSRNVVRVSQAPRSRSTWQSQAHLLDTHFVR